MALIKSRPTSPGRRHHTRNTNKKLSKNKPARSLTLGRISKNSGRNYSGKITTRHRGGGHKRLFRKIDFKRNKNDIPAKVVSVEYDPNRSCHIALLSYLDGEKRYILAPENLQVGDKIIASQKADIKPGNCLTLENIPIGTPIHNIELKPGKGGQLVRSAGSSALIQSKEGNFANVLMPSKEIRLISIKSKATIGQLSNINHGNVKLGKAGRKRHLGWRPAVRGTAQHPGSHPHGGGEGRSGVGMKHPKSPWGKPARGKKTRRKKKYSNKHIIRDRRKK